MRTARRYLLLTALFAFSGLAVISQIPTSATPGRSATTPNTTPTPSRTTRPRRTVRPADDPALEPKWPSSAAGEFPGVSKSSEVIEKTEDEKFIQLARKGEIELRGGEYAKALELLRAAEKINSELFEIQFLIGAALTELGKHEEGVAAFRKAVALDGKRAEGRAGLCSALARANRRSEAIDECREAGRLRPDLPAFKTQLAELYTDEDRIFEAIELLNAAAAHPDTSLFVLGRTGDLFFEMGEYERAASVYERIATQWPDVTLSHLRLSAVYDYLGRTREAIASARMFAELRPDRAYAHYNLGKRLKNAGFFDESIPALLKATSLDVTQGAAYAALSESYEAIGDKTNTLGSLEHAYKYLPPSRAIAYRLGRALTGYGRMADAVEPLELANKLDPGSIDVMTGLGLAYFESNQFDKAIEILTRTDQMRPNDEVISMFLRVAKARKQILNDLEQIRQHVKEDPKDIKVRGQLAAGYRYQGKLREAEAEYLAIIKIDPAEYKNYSYLAIFYSDTGQIEKALEYFNKAAEISKHHVAYSTVASTLEKLGRLDEAIAMMRRSIEVKSTLAFTRVQFGDLLMKKGDLDGAFAEFQAAFGLEPGLPSSNYRLVWYYIRKGNKEGALRHYQILKSVDPTQTKYIERALQAHFGPLRPGM